MFVLQACPSPRCQVDGARDLSSEPNVLRLPSMDVDQVRSKDMAKDKHVHANHDSMSHMDHMDMKTVVFFTLNDLKLGKKITIYFPNKDSSKSPHFLPREEANSIPFSYNLLQYLLNYFSFSKGSPQAKAMENTLRSCEVKPIKGETKVCATSLESMLDFVQDVFGLDLQFRVLTTTHLIKSSVLLDNYTIIEEPKEIVAPILVACHTMPYPYAVFYCHSQVSESKVFLVSLVGQSGGRIEVVVVVCHMDTSQWSRDHVSFCVLGIEPGTSHVCHFFPNDNLVYVPMPTMRATNAFVM